MKKLILLTTLGALSFGEVNAQLALENFNGGVLPAGWGMIKVDNNTPGTGLNGWIVSQLSANAWMVRTRATNDSCMLTASLFTPAGTADRWLLSPSFTVNDPNMVLTWEDAAGIAGAIDDLEVWVSTSLGNTVADFPDMIYDAPVADYLNYTTHGAPLGAYNGQTIRIAFRDNTFNQGTLRLDNVQTMVPTNATDAAAVSVTFPKIVVSTSSTQVKAEIKNNGAQNITALTLTYTVDGGTPVSQNFTGLSIYPYGTSTVTFTAPISNPTIGSHTIAVNVVDVNSTPDLITTNNQSTTSFAVATQTVLRNGLMEEFTSSTCAPCASFNVTFDPLISGTSVNANVVGSRFNVIKYQMDWPAPGNDKSNNAHGNTRRAYYGVTGIPDHYTNGATGGAGNLTEINASKTAPAFMDITGSYIVNSNTIDVSYSVTPYFSITNPYRVHVAAVQKAYDLLPGDPTHTTSQSHYIYVMRRMFPDGNGTLVNSFTAGTPVTNSWAATPFTVGNVTQLGYQFWDNPISSDLVIFVQDPATGEVMQSQVIPAQWPTDVANIANDTKVLIFPNPATDQAYINLKMETSATVNVLITDAIGRVVYTHTTSLTAGEHALPVVTSEFAGGIYNVTIKTEKGAVTERLTIAK